MKLAFAFIVLVLGTVISTTYADHTSSHTKYIRKQDDQTSQIDLLKLVVDQMVNLRRFSGIDSQPAEAEFFSNAKKKTRNWILRLTGGNIAKRIGHISGQALSDARRFIGANERAITKQDGHLSGPALEQDTYFERNNEKDGAKLVDHSGKHVMKIQQSEYDHPELPRLSLYEPHPRRVPPVRLPGKSFTYKPRPQKSFCEILFDRIKRFFQKAITWYREMPLK